MKEDLPEPTPSELARKLHRLETDNADLLRSVELLRLTQSIASVGSWVWDMQTGEVRLSEGAYRIYGIGPADFDGRIESSTGFFHPDDQERVQCGIEEALTTNGQPAGMEMRVVRPDGTQRVVWALGEIMRDADGRPLRMIGTILDITDRKRAERKLQVSEHRLRLALSAARMGTFEWDRSKGPLLSPEVMELLALDTLPNEVGALFQAVHPEDRRRVGHVVQLAYASPELHGTFEIEFRVRRDSESPRWILAKGRVVRVDEGRATQLAGVLVDVSDRHQLEEDLQHALKLESIGRLAGGIAHDFNNLISAISGSVELAKELAEPGSEICEYLETAQQGVERSERLTNQLLSFASRQDVRMRVLDLNELVREFQKLLRRLLSENIEFVVRTSAGMWPARCDRGQLEQVLLNLAVNARDAMEDGGRLMIETTKVELQDEEAASYDLPPGSYACITVSDTGPGMEDEVRKRVFEPFFSTKDSGSGLGLASSYGIVRQMGGTITVQSWVGQGTRFAIFLPRVDEPVDVLPAAPPPVAPAGSETILVVEDEAILRGILVRKLNKLGYRVLEASNGSEALDLVDKCGEEIHGVITDAVMPRMGGEELVSRLRATRSSLVALLVSGYAADRVRIEEQSGLIGFLRKPFGLADCASQLRALLDRAHGTRAES